MGEQLQSDPPVSIAVLAGGMSSRFHGDKAMAEYEGAPLYCRVVDRFAAHTDDIFLQLRKDQEGLSDSVPDLCSRHGNLRLSYDRFEGAGPLGGLVSALLFARNPYTLALAVDLPNVDVRLLRALHAQIPQNHGIVIPTWPDGKREPLCALYPRIAVEEFERLLKAHRPGAWGAGADTAKQAGLGLNRAIDSTAGTGMEVVPLVIPLFLEGHSLDESYFANLNTPVEGG